MSEHGPGQALQDNAGQALLLETQQFSMQARNAVRKLRLQARPDATLRAGALESLLGCALPQGPLEQVGVAPTAYWLAPNDWLLLSPAADTDAFSIALREASGGATTVVTEQTDAWNVIDLSGDQAPARLAQGCALDLHPGAFPSGRYALTRLQHLAVILHRLDDAPRFRILVERSVARFLWDWLSR